MRVDDLRPLPIFAGVSDERLAELLAVGRTMEIEPGTELFHEGAPADHWWVLRRRRRRPVPHGRPRGDPGRADGRARPLGRRLPRVGRARRLPGVGPRRRVRAAAAGAGGRPARADGAVAAAGGAPDPGRLRDRQVDRVDRAPARVAGHPRHPGGRPGPRAEQPGRGRRAHRRCDGRDLRRAAVLARRARARRDHGRAVPRTSTSCGCEVTGRPPARRGWRSATPRTSWSTGSTTTASPEAYDLASTLAAASVDVGVVRPRRRPARRSRAAAGPRVDRRHAGDGHRCSASCARPPDGSPSSSTPCGPTPRWTAPRSSPSTSSRVSRARW